MASLASIRTAIKTTLEAAIDGLHVYATAESANVVPCVVVIPQAANFDVSMGRGTDTWSLELLVMVSPSDPEIAQNELDSYITGAGSTSIRQAIFNARTLGLSGTDAHIAAVSGYGGRFESAGIDHIGAVLTLVVHTAGTS